MYKTSFFAAMCSMLLFSSCEKSVSDELGGENTPTSQLSILTRGEGGSPTAIPSGRVYIFNDEGNCIQLLTTDATTQQAIADLQEGTFDVYAVGGADLSCFSLPTQEDATPTSIIQLKSGATMGDLLIKHDQVTLTEHEDQQLSLSLERKVITIGSVTIRQVPDEVTGVSVTIGPLYKEVRLDGTYTDETENYQVTLTKDANSATWQATANAYHFPPKGNPTILVTFTTSTGTSSYSYTASEGITANQQLNIDGTYSESQGVKLTSTLTGSSWGETKSITFNFDETNSTVTPSPDPDPDPTPGTAPVAGQNYLGCYVVSVNTDAKTAVLLSPTEENNYSVTSLSNNSAKELLNNALASWPSIDGIEGTWRIPTETEARLFLADSNSFDKGTFDCTYFFLDGTTVKGLNVMHSPSKPRRIGDVLTNLTSRFFLRPVIDINY